MEILKALPESATVLPASARLKYWFTANRTQLGLFLLAIAGAVGAAFEFSGEEQTLRAVELFVMLVFGVGSAAIGASKFKSDSYHQKQMNDEIKEKSGQYIAVNAPPTSQKESKVYAAALAVAINDGLRFDDAHEQAMEAVKKMRDAR